MSTIEQKIVERFKAGIGYTNLAFAFHIPLSEVFAIIRKHFRENKRPVAKKD